MWRPYGNNPGNYSVIGNQQSRPEAALVEKVINSVDACLMRACLIKGIDPTSANAPPSVQKAVSQYREIRVRDRSQRNHDIALAVTGPTASTRDRNASITIVDFGEGQRPEHVPNTFLSIVRGNKLRIPFVQGKFNMGGTGALKFCGHHGLQLVITKRCPQVARLEGRSGSAWSVTIVRRDRPAAGLGKVRNSVYKYLAPIDVDAQSPTCGGLLTFDAHEISAFPVNNVPYNGAMAWGSIIKLYEYDMAGFRSHACRRDGLLGRLEIMLPNIALPVRVHECRKYRGKESGGSFDTLLVGLSNRLESDRRKNVEDGFPASGKIVINGASLPYSIYAFKPQRAKTYRKGEGVLFSVDGQTHATFRDVFFERKNVKMGRLRKSLLVMLDCSSLPTDMREDLFMNSRDRLIDGELREVIVRELESIVGTHAGLKDLRERRRSKEIDEKLQNSQPLENILGKILEKSPSLERLFLQGQRLNRRRQRGKGKGVLKFKGKRYPTFFRFLKKPNSTHLHRNGELGRRCRISFETDVENGYFDRMEQPGRMEISVLEGPVTMIPFSVSLHNGVANLHVTLGKQDFRIGDGLVLQCTVEDDTLPVPFVKGISIDVIHGSHGESKRRRPRNGHKKGEAGHLFGGLSLPIIHRVKEGSNHWRDHEFDHNSSCKVVDDSDADSPDHRASLTFYVNMSNRFFEAEIKHSREDLEVVREKWVLANVLVGLGIMDTMRKEKMKTTLSNSDTDIVEFVTRALAPIMLPMIESLGELDSR